MKRLLSLLALALLLAGCGAHAPTESTAQDTTAPPSGLYAPDSAVEVQTGGAVRAYPLEDGGYTWLAVMGDSLLLGKQTEEWTLRVVSGENGVPVGQTTLPGDAWDLHTTELGVSYYDRADNAVIYLNKTLAERSRVALPEGAQANPVVAARTEEIFYCAGDEIRALDPHTGIARPVKQRNGPSQCLESTCFDGKLLLCRTADGQGQEVWLYVDAETGQTVYTAPTALELQTYRERYLLTRMDGVVRQTIFGTLEAPEGQLTLPTYLPALELNGVMTVEAGDAPRLSFYSLETGKKTAAVTLEGYGELTVWAADAGGFVWLLAADGTGAQTLLRWEIAQSPVQQDEVYTHPLVTAEQPDEEALAQCRARAAALSQRWGVKLLLWQDAVAPEGAAVTPEYQAEAIFALLDGVEAAAERFPDGFLRDSAGGELHICLVRELDAGQASALSWVGGAPYLTLTSGCDAEAEFVSQMGYVVDAHVLSNSVVYDYWEPLNPPGFAYDLDYAVSEARPDGQYLEGPERAFIDKRSMSFPTEDRRQIFAYAMKDGCEEYFTSETMQAKLTLLCRGIRQAYGLRKDPRQFPWERYLAESLAYASGK